MGTQPILGGLGNHVYLKKQNNLRMLGIPVGVPQVRNAHMGNHHLGRT
jgi:hypothetical protein